MQQSRISGFSRNPGASFRLVLGVVAIAALFGALAYGGIELTRGSGRIAALWLPNAVLAAILLRMRANASALYIAACLIANIAVNCMVGDGWNDAIILALANAIEITLFVWLMRRLCGRMPKVDELKTMGWLLMLTARQGDADERIVRYEGADDFISKPFDPVDLVRRAELLMNGERKLMN